MSTLKYRFFMNERTATTVEWLSVGFARLALGAAFLSAVADRFGLWGRYGSWGNFANFERYTAKILPFVPSSAIPVFAWAATIAEIVLGIALILGLWPRWVAWSSALLLALFALAMTFSLGTKQPLDYSVFSASACAALLALANRKQTGAKRQPAPRST